MCTHVHTFWIDEAGVQADILKMHVHAQIEGPPQVARRSDMDMNGHINNVTYLGWALETVPKTVAANYSLYQVPSTCCLAC